MAKTQAPEGTDEAGRDGGEIPGPASPRFHRPGTEHQVVWGHHRNPHRRGQALPIATVLDLFSRKLLACPTSTHPDAELACDAIKIATSIRGGRTKVEGVVFHTDRGSTYTATRFTGLCERVGVRQSMGRVGSIL
jgi:transposase InsO family protein